MDATHTPPAGRTPPAGHMPSAGLPFAGLAPSAGHEPPPAGGAGARAGAGRAAAGPGPAGGTGAGRAAAGAGTAGAGAGIGASGTGAGEFRQRRVRLARETNAAALARGEVRAAIGSWGVPVDADVAALLASDLVANAILLGEGDKISLTIRCAARRLRVDLYGAWRVLPSAADAGAGAASGPGLALIATLADEWGTLRTPAGTAVYFTLDYEAGKELPGVAAPSSPGRTSGDGGP